MSRVDDMSEAAGVRRVPPHLRIWERDELIALFRERCDSWGGDGEAFFAGLRLAVADRIARPGNGLRVDRHLVRAVTIDGLIGRYLGCYFAQNPWDTSARAAAKAVKKFLRQFEQDGIGRLYRASSGLPARFVFRLGAWNETPDALREFVAEHERLDVGADQRRLEFVERVWPEMKFSREFLDVMLNLRR